ncbi:hypothetical protein PoB_007591100 [Plakobranchus ocellatus]|uniref:Uncharacterized protein n=1 Tax=Plakobranchus ocellatus TaxID=259542 RepID=A0AAV4DZX8_9GAST|nr:hypothetical protein PoB_007591100 [Plakobranchus ocellatus]
MKVQWICTSLTVSCILASLCSMVLSQAPNPPTDPALFANLFMSSPQTGGSSNMVSPTSSGSPADLSSLMAGAGNPGFSSASGGGSLPPNPMFPTLGSSMGSMPQQMPRPNPLGNLMKMLLFRNMDMGNMWPLMAFGGMGGSGSGGRGLLSNPFLMLSMVNNM